MPSHNIATIKSDNHDCHQKIATTSAAERTHEISTYETTIQISATASSSDETTPAIPTYTKTTIPASSTESDTPVFHKKRARRRT